MGHDAEYAAADVQLKALNNKGIRVDDENGMKTWAEEKSQGGKCGVVPVASIWRLSSDGSGKETFHSSSDGRAIAASWGPGVKNPAKYHDEALVPRLRRGRAHLLHRRGLHGRLLRSTCRASSIASCAPEPSLCSKSYFFF